MDPRRILDPLRGLDLPHNLVRRGIEKAWGFGLKIGRAAGNRLGQDFTLLTQIPAAMLRPVKAAIQAVVQMTSLVEVAARQLREEESSDPKDLREMVAMHLDLIREVFSEEEEPLDRLQPVQEALDLPGGHLYVLPFAQATREAFQEAVHDLDDAFRESDREVYGQPFERSKENVFVAETRFRAGYGLKPIGREELEREWSERLGRLVREAWRLILDRSVAVADRAQQVHDLRAEAAWYQDMRAKPRSIVNWDLPSSVPLRPSHGLGKEGTLPEFENNSERFGATSFTSR
jgi:hypothetical protein